jgi:hypothetical protein
MKKSKPNLEWKLAYVDENGQRRLPVNEAEDRELDEILEKNRKGYMIVLAYVRLSGRPPRRIVCLEEICGSCH